VREYLPAIVFVLLGLGLGTAFALLNGLFGPRRPNERKVQPYECGLPSEYKSGGRFGVSFYLVAMMFIIFDIEVILLLPAAVALGSFGMAGALAIAVFIGVLGVAFVYEWRRGALDWR
jgi:NADH-quinone oxidoreductase subunit A